MDMFTHAGMRLILLCTLVGLAAVPASARDRHRAPRGLDEFIPIPKDNPLTEEKVQLGKRLFFDRTLSRDGSVSCGTCHVPGRMFTNGERTGVGVAGRAGQRNVPSLFNRAYQRSFFWDGRESSLERQVLQPIQNPEEMDLTLAEFEARLNEPRLVEPGVKAMEFDAGSRESGHHGDAGSKPISYVDQFQMVFGEPPTVANAAKALASYIRVLNYADSAFDRFQWGDRAALSAPAQRGLQLFRGKANCSACHHGPLFTNEEFHNTGVGWDQPPTDLGRFEVTRREEDRGRFKTPGLRDVALTAPYMHDGRLATLEDVVEFYDRGGTPNPHLDREIRKLNLTDDEKSDLVAFLKSLSGNP